MVLTNAERQARYKQRLKDAATPAWIRKDYATREEALATIGAFREFFGVMPEPGGLRVLSRSNRQDGSMALLVKMPWPMGGADADMMKGWRRAEETAEDLCHWHKEI
jgi:hypothetical protein